MNPLTRFLSSVAILAAVFCGTLPSANAAPTYYCAIAFSPKTGGYGYTYNQLSAESARLAAIRSCYSRTRDARPATYGAHNAWAALAVGARNGYGWGWGTSKAIAEKNALKACARYTTGGRILVSTPSYYQKRR